MKNSELLFIGIILLAVLFTNRCQSSDKNLTSKNIECGKISYDNAMVCCLQFMSSNTGSDSKDAICRPLVDELVSHLKVDRKKLTITFCKEEKNQPNKDFASCWDKVQDK